jgi:hypothetical protein
MNEILNMVSVCVFNDESLTFVAEFAAAALACLSNAIAGSNL